MVWYSYILKDFPKFAVIHTVKIFHVLHEAEERVFLEFPCFLYNPMNVGNMTSGSSAFLNPACTSRSSWFAYC